MNRHESCKERYNRLKSECRCVSCTATLPDGSKKARCPVCLRKNADAVNFHRRYYGGKKE